MLEEMLVYEVVPRLRNVARTIPKVGHEDDEEIVQDAMPTDVPNTSSASLRSASG